MHQDAPYKLVVAEEAVDLSAGSYEGIVRDRTIVLLNNDIDLADGTKVLVTPVASDVGSQQAVLAAISGEPHVRASDVQLMQSMIDQASRPLAALEPFPNTPDTPTSPNG